MASVRLTNDLRETLLYKMLTHRFGEEIVQLVKDRAVFATKVYNDVYDETARRSMAKLPAGWLAEDRALKVKFGNDYSELHFDGRCIYGDVLRCTPQKFRDAKSVVERRVAYNHHNGCAKVYSVREPLAIEFGQLRDRIKDIKAGIERAKGHTDPALKKFSTLQALVKEWPEIEPFAMPYIKSPPVPLPALPTQSLNELYKLPIVGKGAIAQAAA